MIIRTLLILVILFAIDFYVFQGIRVVSKTMQPTSIKWLFRIYWFVTFICFGLITAGLFVDWHDWPKPLRTYGFAFIFVTYFSKLFLVLFLVIDDVFRLFRWVAQWFTGSSEQQVATVPAEKGIPRSTFLIKLGMFLGAIPFTALLYGMMKGKYDYQVRKIRFKHANLPLPFQGFRIVQVSDIHTGSFMSTEPLEQAVSMINELKPDVIFLPETL